MRYVFLLAILSFFLYPVDAQCYILDGLDYQGGGSLYEHTSYNDIIADLEGTDKRLATKQEIINLFDQFHLTIGSNISVDEDLLKEFVNSFPISYGAIPVSLGGTLFSSAYSLSIIAGRLQMEEGQTTAPFAKIEITSLGYGQFFVSTSIYDSGIGLDDATLDGMTAWIVTPVHSAPEPSATLLFSAGLVGVCGFLRRANRS